MLPIVDDFVKRFKLDDFVIVADSGLMTKKIYYFLNQPVINISLEQESKTKLKKSNNEYSH